MVVMQPPPPPPPPYGAGPKMSDVEYLRQFPPGYRFRPTDEECILEYLAKKINNQRLPPNLINTVQLYAHSPDFLAEAFASTGDEEWYFFTPREKKYKGGKTPDRAAGDGRWKATSTSEKITHNGTIIGSRRVLTYIKGKKTNPIKSDWLMHEFTIIDSNTTQENTMRLDDWVLCKLYKGRTRLGIRKAGGLVNMSPAQNKSKTSRNLNNKKQVKAGGVKSNVAYNEALQSSVGTSSSSSCIEAVVLGNSYHQKRLPSESEASYGNTYVQQFVESYHQIPAASYDILDVPLPSYPQQMANFCSDNQSHLYWQQRYDEFNVEQQPLPQFPYPYSNPPRYSSSSHNVAASLLSFPDYYHQQEPAFDPNQ